MPKMGEYLHRHDHHGRDRHDHLHDHHDDRLSHDRRGRPKRYKMKVKAKYMSW